VGHLVHCAITPADPLVRVRIRPIGRRVIPPGLDLDDRPLGQQRRCIVGVDVIVVPVEVEVTHPTEHTGPTIGHDGAHLHPLAS